MEKIELLRRMQEFVTSNQMPCFVTFVDQTNGATYADVNLETIKEIYLEEDKFQIVGFKLGIPNVENITVEPATGGGGTGNAVYTGRDGN